jgi:Uma2 family endonuclease
VAVDRGAHDPKALALGAPRLVVEALSPTTQATDYMVKTEDYASVATIEATWLVSADEPRVDIVARVAGRLKLIETVESMDAALTLESLGVALTLADIHEPA